MLGNAWIARRQVPYQRDLNRRSRYPAKSSLQYPPSPAFRPSNTTIFPSPPTRYNAPMPPLIRILTLILGGIGWGLVGYGAWLLMW